MAKCDDRAIKADKLLAADCKNNLVLLISPEDYNKIFSKANMTEILANPQKKAALEFQLSTLWYAYHRSYEPNVALVRKPSIQVLIDKFINGKLVNKIEKEPLGNYEAIIRQARLLHEDHPLAQVINYDVIYRLTAREAYGTFQSELLIFGKDNEIRTGGDFGLSEEFLHYLCSYLYLANDAIILSLPGGIDCGSFESRQTEMLRRIA